MVGRAARTIKYGIVIFLLAAVVGFLARGQALPAFTAYLGVPVRGVGGFFWNISAEVHHRFAGYRTVVDLRAQLQDQEQEIQRLLETQVQYQELVTENAALRRTLNFYEQEQHPLVPARIVGQLREGGVSFFLLNRGADDGIRIDAAVVDGTTLLGKIVKVDTYSSVVAPLTAPRVKTAASFAGIEKTSGIIEGVHNLTLVMRLIPKDIAVTADKSVITTGLETGTPRGLLIGTVERVELDEQGLFQTAYINPPRQIGDSAIVSVIKATNENVTP